jgi:O-methyltransferase
VAARNFFGLSDDVLDTSRMCTLFPDGFRILCLQKISQSALKAVAIAWIDCDLYESTKPALEFLTERLSHGSVICFDDWFNIKARPDCGEQKACHDWLTCNPQLRLTPYSRFGWHGQSFIVHHVS